MKTCFECSCGAEITVLHRHKKQMHLPMPACFVRVRQHPCGIFGSTWSKSIHYLGSLPFQPHPALSSILGFTVSVELRRVVVEHSTIHDIPPEKMQHALMNTHSLVEPSAIKSSEQSPFPFFIFQRYLSMYHSNHDRWTRILNNFHERVLLIIHELWLVRNSDYSDEY